MHQPSVLRLARRSLAAFAAAAVCGTAFAGGAAYMTGSDQPFWDGSNLDAMDAAFGAGNWSQLNFGDAISSYSMVYIDGGGFQDTDGLEQYLDTHRSALESYVEGGGRLFINAATDPGVAAGDGAVVAPFSLVFGATSIEHDDSTKSQFATLADPSSPLAADGAGTHWAGGNFANNEISLAPGFTPLITDDATGYAVLTGGAFGSGYVMLGGQTNPSFDYSPDGSTDPFQLRVNELEYTLNVPVTSVPEPTTAALLLCGLAGVASLTFRKRA